MDALTKDEIRKLLSAARKKRQRDWLMILTAWTFGLRVSELLGIKREHVKDGFLTVKRLKHSKQTTQPIYDNQEEVFSARSALIELAAKTPRNQKLFRIGRKQFWRLIQEHGQVAGIPRHKLHPHALRHSCAMQLIDSAGIHRTQAWLGHKSMASTGVYLNPSDKEVAEAACRALGGIVSN